jgi:magnesium transporter
MSAECAWYPKNMLFRYQYHGGVWVDLEHPSEDEIRGVTREFGISERLETELFAPTPSPLVAGDSSVTYLVLHFPTHGNEDGEIHDQEVDFIIGSSFIITVRYEVVEPIRRLQKLLETEKMIDPRESMTTDALLEVLFAHLYTSVRNHTTHISEHLAQIEHDMFSGRERATVTLVSGVSRELLHIEAALANQEEPLNRFLKALATRGFFGASFNERAERIVAEHLQVARVIGTYRAVTTELRETNASLLEARQNEIMKTLTVLTFAVMPLELIALLFGMHVLGTPLETNPSAFWIIILVMIVISAIMLAVVNRRHWLT